MWLERSVARGRCWVCHPDIVDPAWVGRGERTKAEKRSKCSHQSSGAGENAVRKTDTSAKTCDCVLPERFDCQVNSEGTVPPWDVGCVAHVLSRSEKRDDGHNVRVRLRMRECRGVSTQAGGAVDPGTVRGEMAKLVPGSVTGTSLVRTGENGERLPRRFTTSRQGERDVFTNPIGLPRNLTELAWKPMMGHWKKYISKSSIRRKVRHQVAQYITKSLVQLHGETPGCSACLGVSSQRTTTCRERFERLINPNATVIPVIPSAVGDLLSPAGDAASTEQRHATQPDTSKHVRGTVGMKRGAEDNLVSSSAKRAHTIPPPVSQILPQPDVHLGQCGCWCQKMRWRWIWTLAWGRRRCEEMQREPVRCGRSVPVKSMWKYVQTPLVSAANVTLAKFWSRMRKLPASDQNPHRCKSARCPSGGGRKYEKSSMETVISTKTSLTAKRDEAQPLVSALTRCVHLSTPRTHTVSDQQGDVDKCRRRQLESCYALPAFFRDWLERDVRAEPPKDPRLSDGWCWQLVRALLLLSPGVRIQWLPGSAHMTTDAKCVENLAGLSEVKGLKPSSRVAGRGQRDVLELSTAAEAVVFRGGMEVASCFRPRGLAHYRDKEARPRHADAKHGVGLDRWRLEWTNGVRQVATCWCCSI